MDNIKLLGDRVLVSVDETEVRGSGLVISKSDDNPGEIKIGVVVAAGPGRVTDNGSYIINSVAVGNKIMFNYGTIVKLDGKDYLLVNSSDVILILNN